VVEIVRGTLKHVQKVRCVSDCVSPIYKAYGRYTGYIGCCVSCYVTKCQMKGSGRHWPISLPSPALI
jgi:hypothetical protein